MSMASSTGRASYQWLIAAAVAVIAAYAWYVLTRFEHLNELNERQLANAGVELQRTLENALTTVRNFKPVFGDDLALCNFDDDQPYLSLESTRCDPSPGSFRVVAMSTKPLLSILAEPANPHSGDGWRTFSFTFNAAALLDELTFLESIAVVFIADADGRILFEHAPAQRRWRRFLRWGEQRFRDAGADMPPALQIQRFSDVVAGTANAPSWAALSAASRRVTLQLGDVPYLVYVQPLAADGVPLVIGGAVPRSTVVRDALVIDSSFVAMLIFLLLLATFGFPFVKLASLDRRERFRLHDVTRLYLSTVALLVLMTFAALGLDGILRWRAVADEGLAQLAQNIAKAFTIEVGDVLSELTADDDRLRRRSKTQCREWRVRTRWFGPSTRRPPELPLPPRGILLEQVALIRPSGAQVWKTTTDKVGGKVPVDYRAYFQAVRHGDLYQIEEGGTPFFVGPERSVTDGKFRTFVSIRSSLPEDFCKEFPAEGPYTAAATARLLSLHRPALPAGYGFAIVNREGRVLYHSDSRLSLRENFFDELADGDRARAVIYSGHQAPFATRYRQRPHQLWLEPIKITRVIDGTHAPLYAVAFRDTSMERTIVGRVFVVGLAGPILFPLMCIGLTMWLLGWSSSAGTGRRWSVWLWPHGGLQHTYRILALLLTAEFIACLALYGAGLNDLVVFVVPLVSGASAVIVYGRAVRRHVPRRPLASPWWEAAMLVLLLACAVVVPTGVFFRTALVNEFAKTIATERDWIRAQEEDALLDLRAESGAEEYPSAVIDQLVSTRRAHFGEATPLPFRVAETRTAEPGTRQKRGQEPLAQTRGVGFSNALFEALDGLLPIDSDVMARQRYQALERQGRPAGAPEPQWPITGTAVVCFAVMLGLLVAWIRWTQSRLFYAAHESLANGEPIIDPEQAWAACTEDERHVLVQVTRDGIANPHQHLLVSSLIARGLLCLDPDLQPSSQALRQFILERASRLEETLASWERVAEGFSWRYMRTVLVVSVGGVGLLLIATQPNLQSGLLSIAVGMTGALTTGLRLRDAISSWLTRRKGDT
jgi:hypothetical protein